jgi:Flagellar hook-length control protein FliK
VSINPLPPVNLAALQTANVTGGVTGSVTGVAPQPRLADAIHAPPLPSETGAPAVTAAASAQSALADLITAAAIAQDGLAGLFADLSAAASSTALPDPVRRAVQQTLAALPALDATVSGPALRNAVDQSGLFLEARLAQAVGSEAPGPVAADFKALLLQLAELIDGQLATVPAVLAEASATSQTADLARKASRPPPPVRGGPSRGQSPSPSAIDDHMPAGQVLRLLARDTHAALARLELSQAASARSAVRGGDESRFWTFELPVAAPDGHALAQFEITRDPTQHGVPTADATWRTRFAMTVSPAGPVEAELSLTGGVAHVTLWVEDAATRAALEADRTALVAELRAEGLEEAAVRIVAGAPPPPQPPAAGTLLDRST